MSNPIQLKIGYLGGGSRGWAQLLMNDLAQFAELGGEVLLYDLDAAAAKVNQQLGNWLQEQPGVVSRWRYRAVDTIEDALRGVDFVVVSIQPGSLEMMCHEVAVAERYGLFFPVGDTTGAPGLMRGLRSAIIYARFAHEIVRHCPDAWVINYTNPMSVCTRTLTRVEPRLKAFGCCHEVFGTQALLAQIARQYLELEHTPARGEIEVNVFGINHFTWIDRATYRGHDLLALLRHHIEQPGVVRPYTREEVEAKRSWFTDAHQIKFELFRRYGILAAARWRKFISITLPMLSSVIFFNLVMQIIGGFMAFTQAYVITGGGPLDRTLFYAVYLYQKAFRDFDMGYASAMAWVLLLIIAVFTALVFRSSGSWVHYESKEG